MDRVQAAQNELERACQHLSTLRYGSDLYSACGKLRNRVHALWYRLEKVAQTRPRMSHHDEPSEG